MTEDKIIKQFNDAVNHVSKAVEFSKVTNIPELQSELSKASLCIYSALEWSVKNYLIDQFNDSLLHQAERDIINGNNFYRKFALFEHNVSPSFENQGINGKIITDLKQEVRNNVEHSGFIPPYNSLLLVINEVRKIIKSYICNDVDLNEIIQNPGDLDIDSQWTEFYLACDTFDVNKKFILIVGPNQDFSKEKLELLSKLNWSLVIDFNPKSENNGFLKYVKEQNASKRIHTLTSEDTFSFSLHNSLYYLLANGLEGRASTISDNFRDWNRKNASFLPRFFNGFFRTFEYPCNIIVLWDDKFYIQKICEYIDLAVGSMAKWVFAFPNNSQFLEVANLYDAIQIDITIPQIADGILKFKNLHSEIEIRELYLLPSKDEEFVSLPKEDFLWIEEDFEILHRNIVSPTEITNTDVDINQSFYKGNKITWIGLQLHHDITREKLNSIKKRIEKSLKERSHYKYVFQHHPGIGGTTMSLRIAWDLHKEHPVLILKNLRLGESINKVFKLFDLTRKSPLIIVDVANANADDINRFHDELLGRGFPFVLLIIQRNDFVKTGDFNLEDILTDIEFSTFISKYKTLSRGKSIELDNLVYSSEKQQRHPFFIGLTAFEENFDGLEKFVQKNIQSANATQLKIMSIIALNYYYGQQETSAQFFSSLLSYSESSVIKLDRHLNPNLTSLLINTKDIHWKPIHYLVSQQILTEILSDGNSIDWKLGLPDLALQIIKLIAEKSSIPSNSDNELLKRLFVYRDSQEILGRESEAQFSKFVESGLQSDEARLRVFLELTNSFPEESHYWAHLARFYSTKMKNHEGALEAIEKALQLDEDSKDPLLYHMKGMCIRSLLRDQFIQVKGQKQIPESIINKIRADVNIAGEAFDESRYLNSNNEHAYISDIQLIINTLDFFYSISKKTSKIEFLRTLNPWLQSKLDLAEELLEKVKTKTQMQQNNSFVASCDLNLQELYENFTQVIEGWNNQLIKPEINKSVVRRSIIRAYLRRAKSWEKLDTKEVDKILKLIEDNIQEEPGNGSNIYLWFQAARQTVTIDVNTAIDKVATWKTISEDDESFYYLGVLHSIQAISGTSVSKVKAEKIIRELSERKRNTPYRTHCFEWLGKDLGLKGIIPYRLAVQKDDNGDFLYNSDLLLKTTGKISFIKGPEAGNIELSCGLICFFTPARGNFTRDKDLNANVKFYLGFSNDGLRAFDVELV